MRDFTILIPQKCGYSFLEVIHSRRIIVGGEESINLGETACSLRSGQKPQTQPPRALLTPSQLPTSSSLEMTRSDQFSLVVPSEEKTFSVATLP